MILDPVNRKSNGFGFAVTPYNVQSEYQFGAFTDGQGLKVLHGIINGIVP